MNVVQIAILCHEMNRAWCAFNGDDSQVAWEKAPQWQRDSAVAGVKFHILNPDADDSASHVEWSRVKLADGWIHGPEKDEIFKTHPCLVPYEELDAVQRWKDRMFRTLVHEIALESVEDVD